MELFDKNPNPKKVIHDIIKFYEYNSILMYPAIIWYVLCSIQSVARHIPKEAFIIVTVLLFILDILHIFLMTLVIRREKHNTSLRSIEHKIIITKKKGTQYKSPVRIHFWAMIPFVLYFIGAIILIMDFMLQIELIKNIDLIGNDKNWMLSNVISIIGIVATIIRVLVNRQSKRHVAALAIYIDEHPSELNINY